MSCVIVKIRFRTFDQIEIDDKNESQSNKMIKKDNQENEHDESQKNVTKIEKKAEVIVAAELELEVKPFYVRLKEVLVAFAPLGVIAFGGPAAHIGVLHTQFVDKYQWLDDNRFVELLAVGQGLPGPTSTQMVVAVGASHAGVLGGLLAFMLWNVPSFIILVTVALISRENLDTDELPNFLQGLPPAAISLVFIAAYKLGIQVLSVDPDSGVERYVQDIKIFLATLSTVVTLLVTGEESFGTAAPSITFPGLLIFGGLVTLADSKREGKVGNYFTPPTEQEIRREEENLKRLEISPLLGGFLVFCWIATLVAFIIFKAVGVFTDPLQNLPENSTISTFDASSDEGISQMGLLFESMYRMGSIIYGGGQVVLPMLLEEVVETGWVSEAQFLQGFGLIQALPGPLFNFSSYLGAAYLGIKGAFIAWLGLFGPGVTLILAFLPFWARVRQVAWFKCFLTGVNAAAIGLIIAATAQLWETAVETWADAATFYLTGSLIFFGDPGKRFPKISLVWVPICVFIGGLFGWILVEIPLAQSFD